MRWDAGMPGLGHAVQAMRRRQPGKIPALAFLCVALLVAACGGTSPAPSAQATQTASAQATLAVQATRAAQVAQAAQPVAMTLTVQSQGSVASHHLILSFTFTLTNHGNAPIHMYRVCGDDVPPLRAEFIARNGQASWLSLNGGGPCTLGEPPNDFAPVLPPGASHTWVLTENYSGLWSPLAAPVSIQPGTYLVLGWIKWHTGSLGNAAGFTYGVALTRTMATVP